MIETDRVTHVAQEPELVDTPSHSGQGQKIARCPRCRIAIWSHYGGSGPLVQFVRVGTLDEPDRLAPNIHIFTASKQPWFCRRAFRPCRNTTTETRIGHPTAWIAGGPCYRGSEPTAHHVRPKGPSTEDGSIDAGGSTRVGEEQARNGKIKEVNCAEAMQALVFASQALGETAWLNAAHKIAQLRQW
jgi:hypothetical protein